MRAGDACARGSTPSRPAGSPSASAWSGVLLAAGFVAVAWRAVQLQVVQRDRLSAEARDQYVRQFVMTAAPRRHHRPQPAAAGRHRRRRVGLRRPRGAGGSAAAPGRRLAQARPRARPRRQRALAAKVERGSRFVWVKRRVSPAEAAAVRALELRRASVWRPRRAATTRKLTLAGQLIGVRRRRRHRPRRRGARLDDVLRGEPTEVPSLRDGARPVRLLAEAPVPERAARGGARRADHRPGPAARHRAGARARRWPRLARRSPAWRWRWTPLTGEVLAMASWPPVNPNAPRRGRRAAQPGRAPTPSSPAPPSRPSPWPAPSTAGVLRPGDAIDCRTAATRVGGHVIHDHKPLGWVGPAKVLAASSNVGAARIGARLGKQGLTEVLAAFGFGERTGIDLPGERRGSSPSPGPTSRWPPRASARGSPPPPLQVVTAMAAIANGGTLMKPRLVRRVRRPGRRHASSTRPGRRRCAAPSRPPPPPPWPGGWPAWSRTPTAPASGPGPRAGAWPARPAPPRRPTRSPAATRADRHFSSFVGFAPGRGAAGGHRRLHRRAQGGDLRRRGGRPVFREIAEHALKCWGCRRASPSPPRPPAPRRGRSRPRPATSPRRRRSRWPRAASPARRAASPSRRWTACRPARPCVPSSRWTSSARWPAAAG